MFANGNNVLWAIVIGAAFFSSDVNAEDLASSLTCTSNAKARRDFGFIEKKWMGPIPADSMRAFDILTKGQKSNSIVLRDKVFSALNSNNPVIRSIAPAQGETAGDTVEFTGIVLGRTEDTVFMTWTNDINKVWLAVVDRRNRKATVTHVFQGLTSVGGELETLDCK